jgi:4-diphosphocytidyl-2-C-methyl-D-erythritol kinase
MPALSERARAKVNLTLAVLGRRADGYHELESLVAFADCADTLTLTASDSLTLDVTGPRAAECGDLGDNLVLKAARALGETIPGLTMGAFTLDKHLPAAAGIGGGSADAAAALRLLARANHLSLDDPRLAAAARATGADVPVCLLSSACVMEGAGEEISPVALPKFPAVLVNPGVPVATRDVFAALRLKPGEKTWRGRDYVPTDVDLPSTADSIPEWLLAIKAGGNDLETPATWIQPVINDVLAALLRSDGRRLVRMSGSGATCFGLFVDAAAAQAAVREIRAKEPRWWVEATTLS